MEFKLHNGKRGQLLVDACRGSIQSVKRSFFSIAK